jgi:hypothetical protein
MTMIESKKLMPEATGVIWAVSSRGQTKGQILVPHKYQRGPFAGSYIASRSKYKRDYEPVSDIDQLSGYVARGYGIRMSPQNLAGKGKDNWITPASIRGWR